MSGKLEVSELGGNGSGTSSATDQSLKDDGVKVGYSSIEALENTERPRARNKGAFDVTGDVLHYKPISTYEGIHRWDPDFEWTEEEEKKVVRKIDLRIGSFACITFFALQLDRGNVLQALADNLLGDLGLTTNDYNTGQTIFYVMFFLAELPSQLISKKIGPDRWIPIQMVCWSLIASFQAFLSGKASYFVCRALLGLFEGGFIPDTILFLSYWYKTNELPRRLGWFWISYQATSVIGAFLAYGFLHLRGYGGQAGWRYLFAFEGLLTGLIGVFAAFYMPASPTQTAGRFRGKNGWFSEREEKIMVNRVIRDDPSKGDMHNRQAVTFKLFIESLCDYDMWPIYALGLTWLIPPHPMTAYITLQLKSMGFTTFETNLLTIPAYALFVIQLVFWTWLSERINRRFLLGIIAELWNLAAIIALAVLPADVNPWSRYVLAVLLVGSPYLHAVMVAMTSRNSGSVRTRTVATAMYNMLVQASSIIATNIYREEDKPLYRTGNKALIGITILSLLLFLGAHYYYVRQNKIRSRIWDSMLPEEKDAYIIENKDRGNKRLDFRFIY